jgi:adenylosuccinate synthase
MQIGKFNVLHDQAAGSSGKGKMSGWLVDHFNIQNVSSSNKSNAGHSLVFNGKKFVSKAIPTAAFLKEIKGLDINCWISPDSGFSWKRLLQEWNECARPKINIHARASIITEKHAEREREGKDSTKHIASTMQGSGTAMADKILRKPDCILAGSHDHMLDAINKTAIELDLSNTEIYEKIKVLESYDFRTRTQNLLLSGNTWLHEGSQGYALSIDHGIQYPFSTSRNVTTQKSMDEMAIPPKLLGDVYLNLRTFPIRVGNVIEDGKEVGYSGDFYHDSRELTWEEVGTQAGMSVEEIQNLIKSEYTTVSHRLRRVFTFSWIGLKDAVITNGATKLIVNFIQYIDWRAAGLRGGKEALSKLPPKCRAFINKIEDIAQLPVVLIGTGADHEDVISLL